MIKFAAVLGDYYHQSEWAKQSLETALNCNKEDLQIEYCSPEQLKEVLEKKPDAVIHFKENRVNPAEENIEKWMTEDIALEITKYVQNGGGWLAWHSGLASFPVDGSYIKMLKGHFLYHPEKHQMVHYYSSEGNSVLPIPTSFELIDEHYFVHCDTENTNIFLLSESIDGQAPAGWSHSFGFGRVCCVTPAHTKEGLMNHELLKIIKSCVNWLISR
ncbi:ThuA domain-containing protein [Bacillus sp. EB106-08-02-XG196]|jgi:type 1 glutamine amidotransferase|uniref:ThuA domain-containing protein n=1 Tax=Bacillus sp. EB106-08-02-XG196 TaxID=2737049 RepID=UPI0015C45446|nr:ThuA domain-containing protein [Bacillus sp. EB106-08-02-XG196]NWQ43642.1 ThuA domain-containing protein [Bacillus sp. EB106-08-02-XG196]